MGNTITVITTIIISAQVVISARCIGPSDEKSEDAAACDRECRAHSVEGKDSCIRTVCDSLGSYCQWEKDDGEVISNPSAVIVSSVSHGSRTRGFVHDRDTRKVKTSARKGMIKKARKMKDEELKNHIVERFEKCGELKTKKEKEHCGLRVAKELCNIYFRDGIDNTKLSKEMKLYVSTKSYFMYSLTAKCHSGKPPRMNEVEEQYFKQEKSDKSHITQSCSKGYKSGRFNGITNVNDFCYTAVISDASTNYCHNKFGRKTWKILKVEDKGGFEIIGFQHICGWPDYYSYKDGNGKSHRTRDAGTTHEERDDDIVPMIPGLAMGCERTKKKTNVCHISTDITASETETFCRDYGRQKLGKRMSAIERWGTKTSSTGYIYGHFIIQHCLCETFKRNGLCGYEKINAGASAYVGYDDVYSSNSIGFYAPSFYNNGAIGENREDLEKLWIYNAGYQQGVKTTKQRQRREQSRALRKRHQRENGLVLRKLYNQRY